jgi:uncharacterized membrane protein
MDWHLIVKTVHIVSAAVLFGTGMGIAFFMWRSGTAGNAAERFFAARQTVLADYVFTLPAVIVQPLSGIWLIRSGGFDATEYWLAATYILYAMAGACWVPVVWIQIRLKALAAEAARSGTPLPDRYHRLFRIWFLLGWPAFGAVLTIFFLMVVKPS